MTSRSLTVEDLDQLQRDLKFLRMEVESNRGLIDMLIERMEAAGILAPPAPVPEPALVKAEPDPDRPF